MHGCTLSLEYATATFITPHLLTDEHTGTGTCLSSTREVSDSPIIQSPNDGSGEFGDGHSVLYETDAVASGSRFQQHLSTHESLMPDTTALPHASTYTPTPSAPPGSPPTIHTRIPTTQDNIGTIPTHANNNTTQHWDDTSNPDPDHGHLTIANLNRMRTSRIAKKTAAYLKIATLNMRGFATNQTNKWADVWDKMRRKHIGVLALQETHMTADRLTQITQLHSKRMEIFFRSDPLHPNSKGVAIVLNKQKTNIKNVQTQELIPGRALLLTLPWHNTLTITILAIYAPNNEQENATFWTLLNSKWLNTDLVKPDILLGDCNIVEDAIDHLPTHADNAAAVEALQTLKSTLHLNDGWRAQNPTEKVYTYHQKATSSNSRIDRIYMTSHTLKFSRKWSISKSSVNTDHYLASAKIFNPTIPFVGKGRWTMPLHLLKNKKLLKTLTTLGIHFEQHLANMPQRSQTQNAQTLFKDFKNSILAESKKVAKISLSHEDKCIQELEVRLTEIQNDATLPETERILLTASLQNELDSHSTTRRSKREWRSKANHFANGERLCKEWTSANKPKTPRDTIYELKQLGSNPPLLLKKSRDMVAAACKYHNDLQTQGLLTGAALDVATTNVLDNITTKTSMEHQTLLNQLLSYSDVADSLKSLPSGKAAGLNGLPTELWKVLDRNYQNHMKQQRAGPGFDILHCLQLVYNNIQIFGVTPGTAFSEGWMCPLYKKKERNEIANYRPITLMNSDYKIFTKALTTRLNTVAPSLIHKTQAGFMAGRSIFDQVKLTKLIIDYMEATEQNGVIVALDQEKAYDKIRHDYLWKVLEKLEFPDCFISTVRSLYETATTVVILNGVISKPYCVTRGVRQGDPLSCLLFNLAIEPLAAMLRRSPLQGFQVPGVPDKILEQLYADDTTVCLSEHDDFTEMQHILTLWCSASGAKFNISKTEILPVGTQEYRLHVVETRQLHHTQPPIPMDQKINVDGELMCTLGCWVGNNIDNETPWTPVLEKIDREYEMWLRANPP